ncbi:regulatory protein RecX [Citricoccus sp. NPDC079358]|uniref:Regulatory protein RecX n=1 Tax=Citricoccus muralis TaxID=169134 RepID=A0A3D9LA64_9MICC|nr:regulatory protein RecX [Citricoccus muralis]REE02584.1 regulatory protein [Citricoccus muralis]
MTRRHLRAVPDVPEHLTDDPEPAATEVARTIVLRQLAASPKSRKQLEEKLAERDVPEDVAAAVLDRLEDVRLVDDTAYAENFVRTRQRSKGLARGALRRELQQKGVSGEAAEQALETISEDAEREAAVELVQRKIRGRQLPHGDSAEDRAERDKTVRRLAAMLARKGYPPGMALGIVKDVLGGLEDEADAFALDDD